VITVHLKAYLAEHLYKVSGALFFDWKRDQLMLVADLGKMLILNEVDENFGKHVEVPFAYRELKHIQRLGLSLQREHVFDCSKLTITYCVLQRHHTLKALVY